MLEPSLFQDSVDECLTMLHLHRQELRDWLQIGWLSFDIDKVKKIDDPEWTELCFVRDVAKSGLSDAAISKLFKSLEKPYAYPPLHTAYNFALGWVQVTDPPHYKQVIEQHIDQWIEDLADEGKEDRLRELRDRIDHHLDTESEE